jgi:hypothetical protein
MSKITAEPFDLEFDPKPLLQGLRRDAGPLRAASSGIHFGGRSMSFSSRARILGAAFAALAIFTLQAPTFAQAQDSGTQPAAAQAAANQPQILSAEELETLVARIALYPDDLVALVLAGSLYPLQIVQAERYLKDVKSKPDLKPDADWDGSVISLLNYPQVIEMMNGDLDWTQTMGEAVVNQQKDVLVAIQQLRDQAVAKGVLKSEENKVIVEEQNDNVVIRPAKKEVTYVPQYDPVILTSPTYVYAEQPVYYGDPYPSYYYPYAPYWAGFITGAAFGAMVDWDDWNSWGGDVDIDIDIDNIDRDDFHFDRDNINNIDWDRNKFNFDRDSIADNLRQNNFDRLDRKGGRDKAGLSNFGQQTKITGRDVRRDVQQGLKNRGGQSAQNRPARPQGGAKVADRKAGQNLGGQTRKASTPRKKSAGANRPAKRPASRVDNRPRQVSGLGDYSRGRDAKSFSQRGRASRGGYSGGRGGYGGGQRIRRPTGGGRGGRGGGRRR